MNVYALYDRKAGSYLDPFSAVKSEVAIRQIKSALRNGTSLIAQFAEDFDLYQLGHFVPETGLLTGDLVFVGNVADYRTSEGDQNEVPQI